MKYRLVPVALCVIITVSSVWAQDPKISELAAKAKIKATVEGAAKNPAMFAELIAGVEMVEGVNTFVEIMGMLEVQELKADVKNVRVAIMTAYMFKKWSAKSQKLADGIAQAVAPELLPPIVAAAAVVMGNQAPIVTEAFVARAPEAFTQTIRNSGAHPETVLPSGLLVSIGLPVAHSVPATGREPTALPVAPPLREVSGDDSTPPPPSPSGEPSPEPDPPPPPDDPPPPPPVPPTYGGQ